MNATEQLTPGAQLKQARELANLSVERVAKDLFLDVPKIQAIEANRFKDVGAPVYAKGYLRKYAQLVNLKEADVLAGYAQLHDAPGTADPIPASLGSMPPVRKPLPRWISWLVGGLIILAIAATLLNLRTAPAVTVQGGLVSQKLVSPMAASSSAAASNAALDTANAVAPVALQFKFTGDSWVEVYDAHDQQVLYDMGTTNTSREVSATPPLRVVLGAANVVSLQINAQEVTVPADKVQAGVAHFVVNTSGALE